jgi:hypothetical protein
MRAAALTVEPKISSRNVFLHLASSLYRFVCVRKNRHNFVANDLNHLTFMLLHNLCQACEAMFDDGLGDFISQHLIEPRTATYVCKQYGLIQAHS